MGPALNAGARFRQRKISVKQTLQVLKQKDIPDFDIEEQQRELQHIETGVEKGEEEEHHLQQVINASAAKFKGANVKQVFIPTPDASKVWNEANKFYYQKFTEPNDYITFSATVEDTSGCPYNMDERDEEFLTSLNKDFKDHEKCTEDEFELISNKFDTIVDERQPFLSMDPQQILKYDEIKSVALDPSFNNSDLHIYFSKKLDIPIEKFKTLYDSVYVKNTRDLSKLLALFGLNIYDHWRTRRIERDGKPVFPTLRFEDPSQKDDNNPYTAFRRREFRQARKTRRTDIQSIKKLQTLKLDLKRSENLLLTISSRENQKLEILNNKIEIFKLRSQLKKVVRDENIKLNDEDLFVDKPKKKRLPIGYVPPPPHPAPQQQQIKNDKDSRAKNKDNNHSNKNTVKNKVKNDSLSSGNNRKQNRSSNHIHGNSNNNVSSNIHQQRVHQNSIHPYVKLPASKIPDIELTTVNTVLRDKLEGIKKAVSDKLIKRRLQDEGWVNFTDDPYNPYFDISPTGENELEERTHIPYSSIISSMLEVENSKEINFSHVFNNNRHYSNNDPDITKINLFTGQVVRNDRHSSLPDFYDLIGDNAVNNDFGLSRDEINSQFNERNKLKVSEVLLKVRKRHGRGGRIWIDRKRINDDKLFDEYLNLPDDGEDEDEPLFDNDENKMDIDNDIENSGINKEDVNSKKRKNAYDCGNDSKKRLKSRFMFDVDLPQLNPIDPSKLNQIGKQTQAVRFGSMLLTKAFDNMHQIRQRQMMQQQQKLQQQQQQREKALREQKEREKLQIQHMLRQQQLHQQQQQQHHNQHQSMNSAPRSISSTSNANVTNANINTDNQDKKSTRSKSTKEKKAKKETDSTKKVPKNRKSNITSDTPKTSNKGNLSDLSSSPTVKAKTESSTMPSDKLEKENMVSKV